MVVINSSLEEMNSLLRKKLTLKDYQDLSFKYGLDLESDGVYLNFELTSDRTELTSKYALAFLFSEFLGTGVKRYDKIISSKRDDIIIKKTNRPFVNILRLKLSQPIGKKLKDLIDIEEKLDFVVGRKRAFAAIGFFDVSKLKFPLTYTSIDKKDVAFVPLGGAEEQNYAQIMKETEQGRAYSALVNNKAIVWLDAKRRIFAMPPIINAEFSSITEDTRDILIDITGPKIYTVNSLTKSLIFNLQFFGEVTSIRPVRASPSIDPNISFKQIKFKLDESTIEKALGIKIGLKETEKLLKSAGYYVLAHKNELIVMPDFYRQDVIHQVDIIDDILRFYGVEKLATPQLRTYTPGKTLEFTHQKEDMRDVLVGLGYEEMDLNILTNKTIQLEKTGVKSIDYAKIIDAKSGEINMVRRNLFPEMLRFISNNLHKKFPQNLFEVGFILKKEDCDVEFKNRLKLCIVACSETSNLSTVKVALERCLRDAIEVNDLTIEDDDSLNDVRDTFITGRFGAVNIKGTKVGFIGEVHPQVLNAFGIELPLSVAEIFLDIML